MIAGRARAQTLVRGAMTAAVCLSLTGCFTAPPEVVQLNPANGSTSVPANQAVKVDFDHPVRRDSVDGRLSVDPPLAGCDIRAVFHAAPTAACRIRWKPDSTGFTFEHPGALFAADTKYAFHLAAGFQDQEGVANSLDHRWEIASSVAPVVNAVNPGDGTTEVPTDVPFTVTFSTWMSGLTTRPAIHLEPPVPGTRVEQNGRDLSRFVVIPGQPLVAGATYRITVDATATDRNGLALAKGAASSFRTGGVATDPRAVLIGRDAEGSPSLVEIAALGPEQDSEPAYTATVREEPRCSGPEACGAVTPGGSLVRVEAATLSADGRRLAVIERSMVVPGSASRLTVVDLSTGADQVVARGAALPSWSPDGARLAYAGDDGLVHVLTVSTGVGVVLPTGAPLDAPATWAPNGHILALPTRMAGSAPTVELADPDVLARFPVPAVTGSASRPEFSPDSRELALRRDGSAAVSGTWLVAVDGSQPPTRLGADLSPTAWTAPGTLMAVSRPADGGPPGLVRVTVSTGDREPLAQGPDAADLDTASVAPGGRQLVFLRPDTVGVLQAFTANADGSDLTQLSAYAEGRSAFSAGF